MALQNYTGTTTLNSMRVTALEAANGSYELTSGTGKTAVYQKGTYRIQQASDKWTIYNGSTVLDYSSDSASSPADCTFATATVTQQGLVEACAAASSKEIAIVNTILYNGSQEDANYCMLQLYNASDVCVFNYGVSLAAGATIALDHKFFIPAGYSLKFAADQKDVQFSISASEDNV